jgi:hypothetical protein
VNQAKYRKIGPVDEARTEKNPLGSAYRREYDPEEGGIK